MADQVQSPVCIIPTGLPPITTSTSQPAPTSFVFNLPTTRPFNHIVVFLIPGVELPPDTAIAVYIALPPRSTANGAAGGGAEFKFLGGIGPGKESAVFKISGLVSGCTSTNANTGMAQEIDMDAPEPTTTPEITIGVSLEPAATVAAQMASLQSTASQPTVNNPSSALVLSDQAQHRQRPSTTVLAQRIIKNAFNFLASFSGNVNGGVEVVPLKAFEEWWRKFEARVRNDPGFLERGDD